MLHMVVIFSVCMNLWLLTLGKPSSSSVLAWANLLS